jgi:trimeric autotransporter adhesin
MSADNNTLVLPEVPMTPELAKAIQDAVSAADIRALLTAEAEKQVDAAAQLAADQTTAAKAAADKVIADQAAVDAAEAAKGCTRTVEIGGRSFTFEGATEEEVDRLELNAMKVAYAYAGRESETAQVVVDPAVAAAAAQRAAENDVVAKVELERKFRAGEISPAEYIQQSGAMKEYLAKEGVSIESLKAVVESNQDTRFEQSWAAAGVAFQNSTAGLDWPGGKKNQELLGLKIAAMGLTDAQDKVAAIAQAYAAMKQSGLYFPNGDDDVVVPAVSAGAAAAAKAAADAVVAAKAAADAAGVVDPAIAQARALAAAKVQAMSSSMFGSSSGMSGATIVSPAVVDAKKIVPADATPAEIMAAWNEEQIKNGINPNDAFLAQHRARTV